MGTGRGQARELGPEQHPAHGQSTPAHIVVFACGLLAGSLCLAGPPLCRGTLSSSSDVLVPGPRRGLLTPSPFPRSENYVIRWASTGVPQDIELLNNLKAVFTVSTDRWGAALLLPASPLLQSCLRLLPSLLPAEVLPPIATFRMHPAPCMGPRGSATACVPLQAAESPLLPTALSLLLVSSVPPSLASPTAPAQTPVLAPGCRHPCGLPSQVRGCRGCCPVPLSPLHPSPAAGLGSPWPRAGGGAGSAC